MESMIGELIITDSEKYYIMRKENDMQEAGMEIDPWTVLNMYGGGNISFTNNMDEFSRFDTEEQANSILENVESIDNIMGITRYEYHVYKEVIKRGPVTPTE